MDVKLPELGENVTEAEVLKVLVREGDTVTTDQPVLELETDKATFELPCPQAGTVTAIQVKKGDVLRIGQTILTIEAGAPAAGDGDKRRATEKTPKMEEKRPARAAEEAPKTEQKPLARATEEPAGRARERRSEDDEPAGEMQKPARGREPETKPAASAAGGDVAAGPAARRLAREHGVDLVRLQGTGSGGRITPEDVQAFVRDRGQPTRPAGAPAARAGGDEQQKGAVERRALTGIEKAAARHLSASWSEIPHVTHHDLADVTELEEARARYRADDAASRPKLTWTVLVLKAVVAALKKFPRFNSTLDAEREELVFQRSIHVGIAVDTEHGLLVPVVRDADRKSMRVIATEIAALAERARARKLSAGEMQGAGFTVTNLGGIGGIGFTPIVNRPQVAILGVARHRDEVALRDGQPVRRIVLPLSLSYDHRAINGADAARFVRYVAELLEDPIHLLMES